MTLLLLATLALIALYGIYIAARSVRVGHGPGEFLDANGAVPGWAMMFVLPGLIIATLGVDRHIGLVSQFGLQASHIGIGLVPVAIAALLIFNRVWFASRVAGLATPGEALGRYYNSVALRVIMLVITVLFALPFAANVLSNTAHLLDNATSGVIPRAAGVWIIAITTALASIIGGWRAVVMTLAMLSLLMLLGLPSTVVLSEISALERGFPQRAIAVMPGVSWDRIPGVIQYASGIGKETPVTGIFSAVAVASTILSLVGVVISPAALYLAQTMRAGSGLAVSTVWLTGGFAAGLMVLGAPFLALRMAEGPVALAQILYTLEPLAGVLILLAIFAGGLLTFNFFVTAGAVLVTREVVITYLLPQLTLKGQRLAARIALGFAFFLVAFMASFMPLICAIGASVALPVAVQMLPAILGLTFLPWISTGAVLAGLTVGVLIVVFTEPLGLIVFEALFVDLPWGRWPLTIHSAAWGLVVNLTLVLLACAATMNAPDRFHRLRLHTAVQSAVSGKARGSASLGVLFLIWSFLAYGPGAVIGNTFFSDPIFTKLTPVLGVPSLWVWQILFWLIGILQIWLLAHYSGFRRISGELIKPIEFGPPVQRRTPDWLATGLARLTR